MGMPEDGTPEWYLTNAGECMGPVSWASLKARADHGSLDPRTDWVWKSGMTDWIPSGQVDGLFVRRAPAPTPIPTPAPTPAPAPVRVTAPVPVPKPEAPVSLYVTPQRVPEDEELPHSETEWRGYGRGRYIFTLALFSAAVFFGTPLLRNLDTHPHWVARGGYLVALFVYYYITLARLKNLGMNRWWALGPFVPLLNLWIGFRLFACPAGYATSRKQDGAGVALAVSYWLVVALVVTAFAFLAYCLFFGARSQEFLRIFKEA
jgi:hypothetical protein